MNICITFSLLYTGDPEFDTTTDRDSDRTVILTFRVLNRQLKSVKQVAPLVSGLNLVRLLTGQSKTALSRSLVLG